MPDSQFNPVNPSGQAHVYILIASVHVPLCWQGRGEHSSMSVKRTLSSLFMYKREINPRVNISNTAKFVTCLTLISAVSCHTSTIVLIDKVITRPLILAWVTGTLVDVWKVNFNLNSSITIKEYNEPILIEFSSYIWFKTKCYIMWFTRF